ncbi:MULTISPECIES: hypothetical protein [unclassified Bacillus (in: firmicutes)]|uniref:hypothetical protein n=1 Tax=unclassified Bacillus (in: firmicutes) TaxID=185979 RepID=UPI0008E82783|nr:MULTISPECIES: hypothetical protein [unclassified Bacillus (in: firmicutes)]SFB21783.1 hypothetical protein SAMN02799634_10921 [Bacillus sp. UNCCL13]SFQ91029.1 hypothetical protein SAMN04488577_4001 [Bacillus sp. cl95]
MNNILSLLRPLSPKTFDVNEYFVITIMLLVWGIFFLLHKKERLLLHTEIIAIITFNVFFATVGDRILAEPPLDFYDTVDYAHGEFFDSILQVLVYPIPILISIHFYRKFKPNKVVYVILWAGILSVLEWISERFFNVFQYNHWHILLSFCFYLFAIFVNLSLSNKINKMIRSKSSTT